MGAEVVECGNCGCRSSFKQTHGPMLCIILKSTTVQGLGVNMHAREAAAFTADIDKVRAFGVSALGGCVEASSLYLQATGLPQSSHTLVV